MARRKVKMERTERLELHVTLYQKLGDYPTALGRTVEIYKCSGCKKLVAGSTWGMNYCSSCGREIRWDD